jgi:hypothetical protein
LYINAASQKDSHIYIVEVRTLPTNYRVPCNEVSEHSMREKRLEAVRNKLELKRLIATKDTDQSHLVGLIHD